MKAEDRLQELVESGEINSLDAAKQEGFIKGWGEALRIYGVVGQSEQLKAFGKSLKYKGVRILTNKGVEQAVKDFENL